MFVWRGTTALLRSHCKGVFGCCSCISWDCSHCRWIKRVGWGEGWKFKTIVMLVVMGSSTSGFRGNQVQVRLYGHRCHSLLHHLSLILWWLTLSWSCLFQTWWMNYCIGCMLELWSDRHHMMMSSLSTQIRLDWRRPWKRPYCSWGWPQDFWKVFDIVVIEIPLWLLISEYDSLGAYHLI